MDSVPLSANDKEHRMNLIQNFLDKVHESKVKKANALTMKKQTQLCTSLLRSSPLIKKTMQESLTNNHSKSVHQSTKESLHYLKTLDR